MFLALHYLDLIAITCVDGNCTVDNVVRNTSIITGVAGKNVPIYKGMSGPIVKTKRDASAYHGVDGFGNCQKKWLHRAKTENIQDEHAVSAIIRLVHEENEKGNEVGVFTIGPMTNLAMAIRMDPDIIPKIQHVFVMGGTVNGWGNMTLTGEFNFLSDPEAAKICIGNFPMTHLLPWETAYNFQVTNDDKKRILREDTESGKLFRDINQFNETTVDQKIYCCDGLCVAAAIDPSIVTSSRKAYGEVMTEGEKTQGGIFYNMYPEFVVENEKGRTPNVYQMNDIDHDKYIDMLEASLGLDKL